MKLDEIKNEEDVLMHYRSSCDHGGRLNGLVFDQKSLPPHPFVPSELTSEYLNALEDYIKAYRSYIIYPNGAALDDIRLTFFNLSNRRGDLALIIEFYKQHLEGGM